MAEPLLSVIVTTYQRPQHLRRALTSLAVQVEVCDQFEVIIVDDGSQDQTSDVVAQARQLGEGVGDRFLKAQGGGKVTQSLAQVGKRLRLRFGEHAAEHRRRAQHGSPQGARQPRRRRRVRESRRRAAREHAAGSCGLRAERIRQVGEGRQGRKARG